MTRKSLWALLPVLVGCRPSTPEPYPVWARPIHREVVSGGFASYLSLAAQAVAAAPKESAMVSFTPGLEERTLHRLEPLLSRLKLATEKPCHFQPEMPDAFATEPAAPGWRLLGRGLAWQAEALIGKDDLAAVKCVSTATKFGLDLATGDALSASLGCVIATQAQRSIAQRLQSLPASDLDQLYSGLKAALASFPGSAPMVETERQRMLLGVQFVQDCRMKGDYRSLERALGRDARPAVQALKELPEGRRAAYFSGFADEVNRFCDHWKAAAGEAVCERGEFKPLGARPWKRFAKAFCGTVPPTVLATDEALTRTRLLAVSAWATAQLKLGHAAPRSLEGLPACVKTDPFTGKGLGYTASGPDFKVYSFGPDGKDDGGGDGDLTLTSAD